MNKSTLKDGMIVTLRGGEECLIVCDMLIKNNFRFNMFLEEFNESLTHKKKKYLDIVKIQSFNKERVLWKRDMTDWDKVPVGTKVMVKVCFDDAYKEGIFLCMNESGHFLTYDKDRGIEHWNYCVLAYESEEITQDMFEEHIQELCSERSCVEISGNSRCSYLLGNGECDKISLLFDNFRVTRK